MSLSPPPTQPFAAVIAPSYHSFLFHRCRSLRSSSQSSVAGHPFFKPCVHFSLSLSGFCFGTPVHKFILKLDLNDDKDKRKALKTVATLAGIDSISMDMKDKKLTVIGSVDPVSVVSKLRKLWPTDIILVGPAKEPEKKEEPKQEEGKKEEEAKKEEEPKKEEEAKKEETKKEEEKKPEPVVGILPYAYRPYYPPMNTYYYAHQSMEENPNACVIC
ncbi:hypothetical protein CsSME_00012911 [Camellia sinensis var. sinensis]